MSSLSITQHDLFSTHIELVTSFDLQGRCALKVDFVDPNYLMYYPLNFCLFTNMIT